MPKAVWQPQELSQDPHSRSDKAEKVRDMFASIAGAYDLNNRVHSFGLDQRWRRAAVRMASVRPGDAVVDVACGTGDLTELFASSGAGSVIGIDFTAPMLDIARTKSRSQGSGVASRVQPEYREGDAMALALPDACADVVSIAFGLRNVSDPERALREFRRILRPGGRLVVLEFDEPRNGFIRWCNRLYTHRIMPFTASLLARDRSGAYRYLPRSVETFLDRDRLREAMLASGFATVEQRALTFGTCVVSCGRVEPIRPMRDPV
ncbi:MAG: bifunctional demethylmenaquinone methyltransferase/2-methoxy-6-polyprenyl-1,4-benzoquinol methylase UbiE [bacterium]